MITTAPPETPSKLSAFPCFITPQGGSRLFVTFMHSRFMMVVNRLVGVSVVRCLWSFMPSAYSTSLLAKRNATRTAVNFNC